MSLLKNNEFGSAYYPLAIPYNYKLRSKELQETGMYDYGWRQHFPDIGRWNGMDQLAEAYTSISPYAYVANNPVMLTDPDGRWIDDEGNMSNRSGQTTFLLGASYQPLLTMGSHGVMTNPLYANGRSSFGSTSAYSDLMNAFKNGGLGGAININNTLSWWTAYDDPEAGVTGIGEYNMLKLKNWYEPAGQGNWAFGLGATLAGIKGGLNAERMYGEGIRRGLSGNYALTGRNLSMFRNVQSTKASMPVSSLGRWAGIAGLTSAGIGVAIDGYAWYTDEISGAKFGLNATIGAYGLTSVGAIPAIFYFGIDNFYPGGWTGNAKHPGVFNDQARLNQENRFNPYWQLWPGAMKQ